MHSKSEFRNSIVFTISFAAAVALLVLLVVGASRAQNPVPPTAREAASSPAFAAKLHLATRPALDKPQASTRARAGRPFPQQNQVIYENGPANGTTDAWTINFGYIVSDSFVPSNTPVGGFDLYVWEFPGDTMSSLQWSITSAPNGGTVYGSGTVSGSSLTDTFISTNQYGYDIDKISTTSLNVNITSGSTYWFNVFNATVPSGDPVFWDENSGVGCNSPGCPSQAYESALGTIPSEAFDITASCVYDCGPPPPPPTCYESGGKFQIIHDFTPQEIGLGPGGGPGVTIDEAGNLYGTLGWGSVNYNGLAYELSPKGQGWVLSPLYSFLGGYNGGDPVYANVIIGPDHALYGTASGGLGNCYLGEYCGLVYSLRPGPTACLTGLCSWTEGIVYQFTGSDGMSAQGSLVFDSAGNLYGTAYGGIECWSGDYCGTIFELTPSGGGWTEKILYNFTGGSNGYGPSPVLLVGHDGNLYGTTAYGGDPNCHYDWNTGCGVVFQLSPSGSGWTETVLYSFHEQNNDGGNPGNLLQDGAGNLYGVSTWDGGNGPFSIVFMLSPSNGKWVLTQLSIQGGDNWEGGGINNLAIDAAGNLYGTAVFYKYINYGQVLNAYIFKLLPQSSGWQFIDLAPFGDSYFNSTGALALDAQGDLYGVSDICGKYGDGTVWELSP